jgi:RNA polymerase sigma-70 factor (ECF subfamily)
MSQSMSQPDSTQTRPLPAVIGSRLAESPSDLEREVVALFESYRSRLLGYVTAFGITGHDGEEVVQEVFLSLFRHMRMGKPRTNLRGWLFRVAHNLALKQRLANQRLCNVTGADEEHDDSPRDPSPTPEEHVLSTQRQRRLLSVVSALPQQDRLCFNLRAEGLRYREIAEVLGISLGSVSISLTRTLARLMRADEL